MTSSYRLLGIAALAGIGVFAGPTARAQTPPSPAEQVAPALASNTPFASLGPLADQLEAGPSGAWTLRQDGDRLVIVNPTAATAVRYYATDWQGDLTAGRSVGVRVKVTGNGARSAGGLLFRLTDGDPRWIAFVQTPNGKLSQFVRKPDQLQLTGTFDIPGGHRPDGDLLEINQIGDTAQLLANGRLISELKPVRGQTANIPAPVGIVAMGTGEFGFANFSFGPLVTPVKVPKMGDDTVPVAQGGNDDIPAPLPPPVNPAPSNVPAAAPKSPETVDVQGLGPLGKGVKLGANGGWFRTLEDGRLVYVHDKDDNDLYINRFMSWPAAASEGRSASVSVDATGQAGDNGAGLVFGFDDNGTRFLTFLLSPGGKVNLYRFKDKRYDFLESFDPPPRDGPDGRHILKVSQKDAQTSLYVDGRMVKAFTAGDDAGLDASGQVGISVLGKGRFAFGNFSFGPAAPPPPAPTPRQPDAPKPKGGVKFKSFTPDTFGSTFGIMAHEFGHFMIGELQIPSTGPEEDVADEFAAMVFIDNFKSDPQTSMALALGNARLWWYMAEDRGEKNQPAFYDEHAPDRARFAKFVCMLYGAAPQNFEPLMNDAGIPDTVKKRCIFDEAKRHKAWDTLLRPYRRRGVSENIPGDIDPATPGHRIEVVYEEPKNPAMKPFAEEIKNSGFFDAIANGITKLYVLPRDTKMVFKDCDKVNCFYRSGDGSVTMCWEMINYIMEEFRREGKGQGPSPGPTPKTNDNPAVSLEQFLAGRWRSRTAANGTSEDTLIELKPQGLYQAQVQTQSQGSAVMLNVQGRWAVTQKGGARFELALTPQQWYPQQMCQQGYCTPVNLQTTSMMLELVDKNTVRSNEGVATRVQ